VWFRFQRVLENTPTVLLLIGRESAAKSAAAVVLRANSSRSRGAVKKPSHTLLFSHTHLDIEILRIRHTQCRFPRVQHDVRLYSCP
jgi:hypothetical protein